MKPIFDRMRTFRRVYSVELPGFGYSDRSGRRYDIRLYMDAIHDMLDLISARAAPSRSMRWPCRCRRSSWPAPP